MDREWHRHLTLPECRDPRLDEPPNSKAGSLDGKKQMEEVNRHYSQAESAGYFSPCLSDPTSGKHGLPTEEEYYRLLGCLLGLPSM